jgi:hypothetical protein
LLATIRSKMAMSSRFCSSTGRPRFDGQSMLLTDAIHSPRNSRAGGGGVPMYAQLPAKTAAVAANTRILNNICE